jgi:tetratricopeptide (TPR) repeat protein
MNKLILYFIVLGALIGCKSVETTSSESSIQVIQQYHEGLRAYLKGDYTVAENMANSVITLNPQHDGALYLLSKVYYDQGRLDESAKFLLKAGESDPKNTYLLSEIAFMYSSLDKHNEAGLIFEKLIKSNPREMPYYFGGIENYLQAKNYKSAIRIVSQQESIFGSTIETCLNRYKIYMAQDDAKKAIQQLEAGITAFPNEPLFLANLIDLYFQQNQHNKAIPLLEKLCEADPENGMAKMVFGDYLINTGQKERGEKFLTEAVLLEGPSIEQKAQILLAKQKSAGCTEENTTLFKTFAADNPNAIIGRTLLGDLYVKCNRPDLALTQYRIAVGIKPDAYPVWKQLLLITYKEELWDTLINISASCQALFPVQPMPFLTMAIAHNKKGNLNEAENAIEIGSGLIVTNDPATEAEFDFQRGVLALNRKEYMKAKAWFLHSISLQPENYELKADITNETMSAPLLLPFADSLLNECMSVDPSNAKFMAIKGRNYYIKNDLLLANSWLEKAIIHGYPQKLGEEWLGDCAFRAGDLGRAKFYWLNAVSLGNQTERLKQKLNKL